MEFKQVRYIYANSPIWVFAVSAVFIIIVIIISTFILKTKPDYEDVLVEGYGLVFDVIFILLPIS